MSLKASVNAKVLEKGRGVKQSVVDMRMSIKTSVSEIIFSGIKAGKRDELADELNRYIAENKKNGVPYTIHHVRATLGLSPIPSDPLTTEEVTKAVFSHKSVQDPIVEIVPEICEKCVDDHVTVTDLCMSCTAHPCDHVCPVDAIKVFTDRSQKTAIDPQKCIRCEECIKVCPYDAIVHRYRPCKAACGTEAIIIDDDQRSFIFQNKCASCGLCTIACPFGASIHKSELGNVIAKLAKDHNDRPISAIVAPAFVSQFDPKMKPADVFEAIKECGFDNVIEVAFGADLDTVEIAERLHNKKEGEYIGTSCCPSWVRTVRKHFPNQLPNIVPSFAPMVETAQALKKMNQNIDVVFIGPCVAKISETLEERMSPYIDHAITFEEMQCIFKLMNVKIKKTNKELNQASSHGRGYAVAGGVAEAVVKAAQKTYGMKNIKQEKADTLLKCRLMLQKLEQKQIKPDIVEGMGCPGGCIGGAGCIATPKKVRTKVLNFKKMASLSLEDSIKQTYDDLIK